MEDLLTWANRVAADIGSLQVISLSGYSSLFNHLLYLDFNHMESVSTPFNPSQCEAG